MTSKHNKTQIIAIHVVKQLHKMNEANHSYRIHIPSSIICTDHHIYGTSWHLICESSGTKRHLIRKDLSIVIKITASHEKLMTYPT